MTIATVPATLDEITADWLTSALREGGQTGDVVVTRVESEVIAQGVGFVGQLARLTLTYAGEQAGAPPTLIVKIPSPVPSARELANFLRLYEREIRFYRDVAPHIAIRTPKLYGSAMDAAAGNYVLLLEEITDARLGDQLAGCSPDEARMLVVQMARLHATWWESPRLAEFAWMPTIDDPSVKLLGPQILAGLPLMMERYGEYVPEEARAAYERWGQTIESVADQLNDLPQTIVHGDWRLDNMFFTDDSQQPLVMLDWQLSWRTTGTYDLGWFAWLSLDVEMRRALEAELLELYHRTLVEGGVHTFSFDDLQRNYRYGLMTSLSMPAGVLSLDPANERGEQLFRLFVQRASAAIMDHRLWELLP